MKYLIITGCTDPQKWYVDKIEQQFPILGWDERDGYKTRETAGYINFVATEDAEEVTARVAAVGRMKRNRQAARDVVVDLGATQKPRLKIELVHLDKSMPIPEFETDGAAAMDLRVSKGLCVRPGQSVKYGTGIALHIKDPNIVGLVVPRSSAGTKLDIRLANTIGVIDSDYQGELILAVRNSGRSTQSLTRGDRIAQILFVPLIRPSFAVVNEFSETTKRGDGGFGSTGGK